MFQLSVNIVNFQYLGKKKTKTGVNIITKMKRYIVNQRYKAETNFVLMMKHLVRYLRFLISCLRR